MTPKRRLSDSAEEDDKKKSRIKADAQAEESVNTVEAAPDAPLPAPDTTEDKANGTTLNVESVTSNDDGTRFQEGETANAIEGDSGVDSETDSARGSVLENATEGELETLAKDVKLPEGAPKNGGPSEDEAEDAALDHASTTEKAPDNTEVKADKSGAEEGDNSASSVKPAIFGSFGSKFSFGSGSGSAFGSSATSAFGAGSASAFGNAGTGEAKTNPWAEKEPAEVAASASVFDSNRTVKDSDSKKSDVAGSKSDRYAQVTLEKQEMITGEEGEDQLFSTRARLYALNLQETAAGWKERGSGVLHLNIDREHQKSRIVMRADGMLRVVLNLPLVANTRVHRGHASSSASEKFVRIMGSESGTPYQYAFRLGSEQLANDLFDKVEERVKSDKVTSE